MASEQMQKGWEKVEAHLDKGHPDRALKLLEEVDGKGEHATTWMLAGRARWAEAKDSGAASTYRKAASNFRQAMRMDAKNRKFNAAYNDLLNDMNEKRIGEFLIPPLVRDGTPTITAFGAMGLGFVLLLFAIGQLNGGGAPSTDQTVLMTVSYTDASGLATEGDIEIRIHADAPSHAASFLDHVEAGTYDRTVFHRVIDDFMIQGGDFQNGDGTGGYAASWYGYCDGVQQSTSAGCSTTAYTLPDEVDNGRNHEACTLSMAKTSSPHTGGSQFFLIPEDSAPDWLDGVHTVFGTITEGCEHVTAISATNTDSGDRPVAPVTLEEVVVTSTDASPWFVFW